MFDDLIPASSDPFADLVPPPQHKPGSVLGALKRGVVDNLAELPIGASNAIKTVVDAFGAGSETAKGFERSAQFYQDLQSPERQAERQRQAQRTHAAEQSGSTWEEIKAAAQNFAESPLAATANAAGSLVPVVVAAKAAPFVAVGAVPAMLTTGAVMGIGAVKGGIYDDQLQRGMTPEQAEAAQAYTGDNLEQIAIGAGLGALASSTGVEKVLGGATSTIRNTARRVLTGAVQEAVPEAIQGGQERLAANIAAQRSGFEDVPTWQGVAGQATAEGLASTGPGGIAGGVQRIADLQPAYVLRPDGQGVTAIDPSAGPISAAAAGHIHQQQAQGGLFDDLGQPTQGAGQMATPDQTDPFGDLIPEQQDQYPEQQQAQANALTPEAEQLLAAVEAGGTPAFMTRNLKRVAAENGIDVTPDFTPNDVVDALRQRATAAVQAPEPRPFDLWRAEAPPTSLQEAQAAVEESRAQGYDGHVVIQHGEGFGFVPRDWLSTDELKAAEALQPQAKRSAAPTNPEPASEKDKWIKATVDKSRLNGSSSIQLEAAPDGGVMFMGDPNSNKDGQALLANYQQALKAGATPAEIAAALKAQAKPTPASSTTPAKTATGKRPNNAGVYWTPDVERSKEPTKDGAVLNVVQLDDGSWTAGAGFGYVGGENLAGVARQDGQRAASREEAITQAVGYATERLDKIIARYEALPDYKDSAKYIAQAKERKAWLQAQLPGVGNAQAEPTFAPATVEDSNGKKREGFIAEFDNGKGGKGYIELAVDGERIYPTMVDNGLFKLSDSTRGAVSKAYEQAIAFAEQNGKAFTSDDSVTVTAARIYDSLARKGYAVQKSPVARLATKPEAVTERWVTDDGSPVFTVAQKAPAKATTPPATRATIESTRSISDGNATQQPGTQEAPAHGGGPGNVPQDGPGPGVRAGTGQKPARARYGNPRQGAVSVVGIHYSGAERQSLSGAYYGKGIKGAEAERLKGLPDQYRHRVHFYVDEGQGVFPEAGVGAYSHEVELLNLYDAKADPLGLAQGNQNDFNGFEQAVVGAGFDGYYVPQGFGRQGVAVVIGQRTIPVTHTGPKAPKAVPQPPILSDNTLPAGQVTGARWKELLAGRLEGVEKLDDGKRYYKDEAVRAVELESQAPENVKQPTEKVTDYGQKIGGSRADRWHTRGLSVADLEEMSASEAATHAKKDQVWPKLDYAALIESGMEPQAAALLKIVRDRLAAAPRKDTAQGRRDYVESIGLVRDLARELKTEADVKRLADKVSQALGIPATMGFVERQQPETKAKLEKLWAIYKGRSNPLNVGYADQRKARQMLSEGWPTTKKAATTTERDTRAEPSRPHLDKLERTGADVRNGRSITPQELAETFGFRGIEFGNWAANDERQRAVNLAFEALHDLAGVMSVPPKALSLNGSLGVAFGARGGGKHAAHYEPGKLVINLTKTQGAGSLAHEWAHALDHYLGELDRPDAYGGKARGATGWTKQPEGRKHLANLRPELAAAFDKVMERIFKRERTQAEAVREVELELESRQAGIARAEQHLAKETLTAKERKEWETWANSIKLRVVSLQKKLAELRDEPRPAAGYGTVESSFVKQGQALSGKSAAGYWTRPTELFARAFESYVFDQIKADSRVSDYLVHGVEADRYADTQRFKGNPYPTGAEREAISAAFSELVQTIQTKETGEGVALFNQATPGTISPADKAVFGMAAEGKSTKEILEFIAAGSRSTFNRQLARLMLAKGIEAKVTVGDPKAWKIATGPGKYAAAYSPLANTVALFRPASAERHMLHELMHAGTMQALRKNGMASGQMKVLLRHVQKHLGKRGHYGLTNLDEFVAEAFTNRQFQEALKRIPGAELSGSRLASAWSWFVRIVRQILGLDGKHETALAQALELGVELMQPATRGQRGPVRGAQGERLAPNGKPSKLSERQWHQVRTPEFKAWFGDWEKAALRDFLDGAPLAQLQTAEAPHQGYAALREWAVSIFADYGFKAIHPELGEVLMDERAVRDSMGHRINPFKAVAFKAVPDVLENGRVVHRETIGELESIYVAAPVRINGVDDIVTVLVHRDPQTQRFYLHSVATKESLQNRKQSGALAEGQRTPGAVRSGGIESILHDVLTFKAPVSQAIDRETSEPAVLWHGSRYAGFTQFKPNELGLIWASTDGRTAFSYSGGFTTPDLWAGETRKGLVPVFMNVRNPAEMDAGGQAFYDIPDVGNLGFTDWFGQQAKRDGKDGAVLRNIIDDGGMLDDEIADVGDDWIVFDPRQVKSADQNTGTFDPSDPDIRFNVAEDAPLEQPERLSMGEWLREQLTNHRSWALGALTRDQLADIYGKDIPEVAEFSRAVERMDQVRNTLAEQADATIERWRKLPSAMADQLADVMHGATLAQFDPAKQGTPKTIEEAGLLDAWAALSPEAQALYKQVRDTYATTLGKLRNGLVARAERAGTAGQRIAAEIRLEFDQYLAEGPYFPLARFGDFVLIANKGAEKIVETFESAAAREKRGRQLRARGWRTRMTAKREYSAATDGPSGEFVGQVLKQINGLELPADEKAQLMDGLNQLAIAALPDQSYRRHFTHRKGTHGFNKDAMRAFASSMQHVAHHVARVQHGDELVFTLDALNQRIKETATGDTTTLQQVSNELARRLDQMLDPNTHPVAAAAGQVGFLMSLGGSVASGLVNLTQTPLVTYPWLGAKFGFDKAAAALTRASKDYFGGRWDKWSGFVMKDGKGLTADEQKALQTLEEAGLISLTQAHDLAGTANTDKAASQRSFAINRAMKIIGWTFHVPEVANRQVSALAAYRLAREKGLDHDAAIETTRETLQRTHFDYSASNRARFMAGNFTRVVTMFKQYSQNMTYLLWRNAYQSLKGESPEVRREARRMLLGVAAMHFGAAGSLGLPLGVFGITPLLGLLAMGMGDEDEPWDWETEYRNLLADTLGPVGGEAIAKGPMRTLLGIDLASRVGLGDLWIRSPQAEKEGRDQVEAWMLTLLGPVAGYIGNMGTAAQAFSEGKTARGLEAMLPKFIASPIKAMRYETEGVRSWRGDDLGVPLDGADVLSVAVGFQPAKLAEMYEGRAAVKGLEAKLQGRREELVNMWVSATLAGDQSMADEALQLARAFSMKHPEMAISGDSLRRSLQSKVRSQTLIKDGVHLALKRDVLREAGRFANVE